MTNPSPSQSLCNVLLFEPLIFKKSIAELKGQFSWVPERDTHKHDTIVIIVYWFCCLIFKIVRLRNSYCSWVSWLISQLWDPNCVFTKESRNTALVKPERLQDFWIGSKKWWVKLSAKSRNAAFQPKWKFNRAFSCLDHGSSVSGQSLPRTGLQQCLCKLPQVAVPFTSSGLCFS